MNAITAISAAALTMSSEEIASLVESRHDNVKTSIERLGARDVIQLLRCRKSGTISARP